MINLHQGVGLTEVCDISAIFDYNLQLPPVAPRTIDSGIDMHELLGRFQR